MRTREIDKLQALALTARAWARTSHCSRSGVAALIVTEGLDNILSIGVNGNLVGGPNGCDRPGEVGNCGCTHAEANALVKPHARPIGGKVTMVTTMSPCVACVKLLARAGVTRVYYLDKYRHIDEAIRSAEIAGIAMIQLEEK